MNTAPKALIQLPSLNLSGSTTEIYGSMPHSRVRSQRVNGDRREFEYVLKAESKALTHVSGSFHGGLYRRENREIGGSVGDGSTRINDSVKINFETGPESIKFNGTHERQVAKDGGLIVEPYVLSGEIQNHGNGHTSFKGSFAHSIDPEQLRVDYEGRLLVNGRFDGTVKPAIRDLNRTSHFVGQIDQYDKVRNYINGVAYNERRLSIGHEFSIRLNKPAKFLTSERLLAESASILKDTASLTNEAEALLHTKVLNCALISSFGHRFVIASRIMGSVIPTLQTLGALAVLGVAYVAWQNFSKARERDGNRIGAQARRAISDGSVDVARTAAECYNLDPTGTVGKMLDGAADSAKIGLRKEITSYEKNGTFA